MAVVLAVAALTSSAPVTNLLSFVRRKICCISAYDPSRAGQTRRTSEKRLCGNRAGRGTEVCRLGNDAAGACGEHRRPECLWMKRAHSICCGSMMPVRFGPMAALSTRRMIAGAHLVPLSSHPKAHGPRLQRHRHRETVRIRSVVLLAWSRSCCAERMTQHILRYCEPGAVSSDDGRTEGNMK